MNNKNLKGLYCEPSFHHNQNQPGSKPLALMILLEDACAKKIADYEDGLLEVAKKKDLFEIELKLLTIMEGRR